MFKFMKAALSLLLLFAGLSLQAQPVVGLDNWFNRETKNGNAFHYLWSDTADSGYSQWGEIFKALGASLKTLEQPTASSLKDVNVYIIVDPDTAKENPSPNYISDKDIKVITRWVEKGGVLVLMANDAPNCEFTHLNKLAANFGIQFNYVSLKPVKGREWDMGAFTSLPDHQVFTDVSKIYMKEVSSLNLSGNAKPVLVENDVIYMAESKVGKGHVFVVGDPWIYNEYIDHSRLTPDFENRKAAKNLSKYLLSVSRKIRI